MCWQREDIQNILNRLGKFLPNDELNCGACGYETCREHAIAIFNDAAESEMCLPYAMDKLKKTLQELASSNEKLARVQEALVQSEKLASMGQLAAGIAHEINNPLGIVLMYTHLLLDDYQNDPPLHNDLKMIAEQTDRCKKIVSGLLNFSRQNKVNRQPEDICHLIARTIETLPTPDAITVETMHDLKNPLVEIDADQIAQVIANLVINAFDATPKGGLVTVSVHETDPDHIVISICDDGVGIPQENIAKIFEPFFTTKRLGKGAGLGLAVAYGIIKMHRGDVTVGSNADPGAGPTGTTFRVTLPRKEPG